MLIRPAIATAATAAALLLLGACGGDDDPPSDEGSADSADEAASTDSTGDAAAAPDAEATSGEEGKACGVTLEEVQALLPPDSGVTENSTPDPGRCNFTWDDGGPHGIDVAVVPGGRGDFDLPVDYEPLEGYGDEAYELVIPGRASAVAFVGDDLHAADVVAGGDAAESDLSALSLELLTLTLG